MDFEGGVQMNCPKCHNGVLESIGHVALKQGTLELSMSLSQPKIKPAIRLMICSNDLCGNVHFEAVPESITIVKKMIRDRLYQHFQSQ